MKISRAQKQRICIRAGGEWIDGRCIGALCEYCKYAGDFRNLQIHHKDPIGMGGSKRAYTDDELILLCGFCHDRSHFIKDVIRY